MKDFDVIVVGAGHAGIEAAHACSRMGLSTLILTMNVDQVGAMSCNPAIGGLGKSQLAREVDALGGLMCRVADLSAMQYRILNEHKGAAVRATRVHVDRHEYRQLMKARIERTQGLSIKQGNATKLMMDRGRIVGVETELGQKFYSKAVVITTGTFLNGKAHIGRSNFGSGRAGEPPSIGLSAFLESLGIRIRRLKTGTVPRLDARTIDFSKIEEQPSLTDCKPLSFFSSGLRKDLMSAHIAYTNTSTHEIIQGSLDQSPLYSGIIQSRGPRYCPSVEDKVVRFSDRERHQVFLEREGRWTEEVYAGGLSTSLPYDCQLSFLRTIHGLEDVEIIRPGYAIEYDSIDATQLEPSLALKDCRGLYFAGQVNGTSGYEEAAAQGILAGINAGLFANDSDPWIPLRSESYIGVMVDDLTTKETTEPYRMFTSRAEWRLHLRQDNAEVRLMPKALELGLVSESDYEAFERIQSKRAATKKRLHESRITPTEQTNQRLKFHQLAEIKIPHRAIDLLRRPEVTFEVLENFFPGITGDSDSEDIFAIETEIKYEGYIQQAEADVGRLKKLDGLRIPAQLNYGSLAGLPNEAVEKLSQIRPTTLGQASRISGITPATISLLAIHISKRSHENDACVLDRRFDLIEKRGKAIGGDKAVEKITDKTNPPSQKTQEISST